MRDNGRFRPEIARRGVLRALILAGLCPSTTARALTPSPVVDNAHRFGFADVVQRARELASAPFVETPARLPQEIGSLDYNSWRDIRFRPDRAIPLDETNAFKLETFHLGFLYKRAVAINLIQNGIAARLRYSPSFFDYGRVRLDKPLPNDTGFAGFRLHYPLNDPHVPDELISFLGASYFRFLGREQRYGLSARALCVEAGTNKESFPHFCEFWLEIPAPGEGRATIYALLDGEAATGAFRFDVAPGQETTLDVTATLIPRRAGVKFGLAPLTSMYFVGKNDHRLRDGFRAELHDFRRPAHVHGRRRVDLASPLQPRLGKDDLLHRQERERLRPHATRPDLRILSGSGARL